MEISTDAQINCMPMKCGALLTSAEFILKEEERNQETEKCMIQNGSIKSTRINNFLKVDTTILFDLYFLNEIAIYFKVSIIYLTIN